MCSEQITKCLTRTALIRNAVIK